MTCAQDEHGGQPFHSTRIRRCSRLNAYNLNDIKHLAARQSILGIASGGRDCAHGAGFRRLTVI
jgi:hypothetical protein